MSETLNKEKTIKQFIEKCETISLCLSAAVALLLYFNFASFVGAVGTCMSPTQPDTCILLKYNPLGENNYKRFDIVAFDGRKYAQNPDDVPNNMHYSKRVIGLPGETITIQDDKVFVNGEELDIKYQVYKSTKKINKEFKLADDEYFVMGDNQSNSYDSVEFGPIKKSDIYGFEIYPELLNKILGYEDNV